MELERVGYVTYDKSERIKLCPECRGWMYDAPELANEMELSEEQMKDLELGFWGVGFCPACYIVEIYQS